jgi:phthiocerol/phenolphthiocerol synthesis type-I polyketide synthase C
VSVEDFWRLLVAQQCSVSRVPQERFAQSWYFNHRRGEPGKTYTFDAGVIDDIWGFDPGVFSITPREARQMDPQQRLVLQLVWEALEDAGVPASSLSRRNIGVYMGASSMDHSHRQYFDPAGTDSYLMTGNTLSLIANRVSYQFDLTGPSLTIDTACSSSLVALTYAVQDLNDGKIDAAIVGGVNALLSPFNFMGFSAASMLSPDGLCRAFDHRANGYVRSEGGVVMILQKRGNEFARHRVHGEILASATNSDGRTSGVALPSAEQQAELLRTLYAESEIDPKRLAFVEAHGTGTPVGDPVECHALGKILGAPHGTPLLIGSAKSNVGHLEPASGIVGLLKAQLALEHGVLPATLHVESLNPNIPFADLNLTVAVEPVSLRGLPASRRLAGVNNFGFGGTNVHVVIGPARRIRANVSARSRKVERRTIDLGTTSDALLLLSAQCKQGLGALAQKYIDLLDGHVGALEPVQLAAIASAAAHGRDLLGERLVVAARHREELASALRSFVAGHTCSNLISSSAVSISAKTAFVFSGNGAQWAGMGRVALDRSRAFAGHFEDVDRAYQAVAGVRLLDLIQTEDLVHQINRTEIAQPLLFAIQVALAKCLMERGVHPAASIGHSVGEVAAAHISGALDLEQAVSVIRARSHRQEIARGLGRMAALQASDADAQALIAEAKLEHVVVAAINSPRAVTVAGDGDEVRTLVQHARGRQIAGKLLDIQYPFHSARLDPARQFILDDLSGLKPQPSKSPMYSTVEGKVIDGMQLNGEYWWMNVRQPVRFLDAIAAAAKDGCQVFIEIGPRSILRSYIADCLVNSDSDTRVVPTFEPADDSNALDPVSGALARTIVAGARFDTAALFGPRVSSPLALPTYAWQNKPFRMAPSSEAMATFSPSYIEHPLLGARLRSDDTEWDRQLDTAILPYLADHKVRDRVIMPGTCYVEMALAAAVYQLKSDRVELRDVEFVQALELSADACHDMRTRVDPETGTIIVSSRARLTADERQSHMRTRFARLPSEFRPIVEPPVRETSGSAPPCDDIYRLAARFHLNYGPAFRRVTACREIGEDVIEVELSTEGESGADGYFLHPVDFDACLHGLNVIYRRLQFGESKQSFVPVRIGTLRVFEPGARIGLTRIRVGRYSTRGAVADFELFGHDGVLVATAHEMRFKAASLVHRMRVNQAAYNVAKVARALPAESMQGSAPDFRVLRAEIDASLAVLDDTARRSIKENALLAELAARRIMRDAALQIAHRQDLPRAAPEQTAYASGASRALVDTSTSGHTDSNSAFVFDQGPVQRVVRVAPYERLDELLQSEASEPLPSLDEIVAGILSDDPSWMAECVMLLNVARERKTAEESGTLTPSPFAARHSVSTIEQFLTGCPRSRAQIAAVAGIAATAVRLASPAQPFRILQLGAVGGGLTRELVPLLADGRVCLVVADSNAKRVGRLASQWQGLAGADFVTIGDGAGGLQDFAHFDFVVSANGLSWMPDADSILARLQSVLADRATVVISEREPDTFHSVVFAASVTDDGSDENAVSLRDGEEWRDILTSAGFGSIQKADDNLSIPGSIVLLAQLDRDADATSIPGEVGENGAFESSGALNGGRHAVVVVGSGTTIKSGFDRQLSQALGSVDRESIVILPRAAKRPAGARNGEQEKKRLAQDRASNAEKHDWKSILDRIDLGGPEPIDIVFALDAAAIKPSAHMSALQDRLVALSGFLRALENRSARLWIIAEGGARAVADLGSVCPVQTGIWSFGRTAINEFAKLDIRLVDFAEGMTPITKAERLARLLGLPGHVRELVLTTDGMVALEVHRGAPVGVMQTRAPASTSADDAVVLRQGERGKLEELSWVRTLRRPPGEHEVEIEVAASGLNFRDVMWSLGLLPEEALEDGFAGPTIGLECAGHVVRVGRDVAGLAIGDPVIAIAPASFASHVTVAARAVARLPSGVGVREAASIPVPFLTSCYGLEYLARVRKNEWVLIHGAAGGVGLAAIQVAKRNDCRIIATAGSDEKRTFLRSLGADYVLDTRSLDFVDQVKAITERGVHVVLNSLAGEAMERSLELLRPFGRFIELGKRDFYAGTKVSVRPLRNNISYFGVDADQLLTYEPDVAQQVLSSVIAGFVSGEFSPLPCRIFKSDEVVDAFRLMQKSGHIGKIIVEAPSSTQSTSAEAAEFVAGDGGFHVVFGGTSGFGLEYARWLADRGARHIVIASRSGGANDEVGALAKALDVRGITLASQACDVSDKRAVATLLEGLRRERPIIGITHTAMVLDDGLIKSLTPERIEKVLAPKVAGARNLDLLTRKDALDYFILFSSAAAMFGNPGQGNYVAANGYLDGLARQRRALGHKAISVAWGAITDVGVLARDKDAAKSLSRHTGGQTFTARDGLDLLAHFLTGEQSDIANITLASMNWGMAKDLLPIVMSPAYDLIRRDAETRGDSGATSVELRSMVLAADEISAKKIVADYLAKEIGAIFRMPPEDINPRRSLTEVGMDSLMGLELRMAVERQIGIDIMKVSMSDGTTINDIADYIATRLRGSISVTDDDKAERTLMVSQHVAEVVDIADLRQLEEKLSAREEELQRGVL